MEDCIVTLKDLLKDPHNLNKLLFNKYGDVQEDYVLLHLDALIYSKNSHILTLYKESLIWDYIDEFLKRFYNKDEAVERLPKISEYYKNYSKFFCNPLFRDFKSNQIVQCYGDNKAAIYYRNNYGNENKSNRNEENINTDNDSEVNVNNLSKVKSEQILFNDTIRANIEEKIITQTTMINASNFDRQYLDEQTVTFDGNETERNYPLKTDLLTKRDKDNSIADILNNLGEDFLANMNRRINDRIINKINSGQTKPNSKSGQIKKYNASTVDKTNEGSINKVGIGIKSRESGNNGNTFKITSGSSMINMIYKNSNKLFEENKNGLILCTGGSPKKFTQKIGENFIIPTTHHHMKSLSRDNNPVIKNNRYSSNSLIKINPCTTVEVPDFVNLNFPKNRIMSPQVSSSSKFVLKTKKYSDVFLNTPHLTNINNIISPRILKPKKIALVNNEFKAKPKSNNNVIQFTEQKFSSSTRKNTNTNVNFDKKVNAISSSPLKEHSYLSFDKNLLVSQFLKSTPEVNLNTKLSRDNPTNLKLNGQLNYTKVKINLSKKNPSRPNSNIKLNLDNGMNCLNFISSNKNKMHNSSLSTNNNILSPQTVYFPTKNNKNVISTRNINRKSTIQENKLRNSNSSKGTAGLNNYLQLSNKLFSTSHQNLNDFFSFKTLKKDKSINNDKNKDKVKTTDNMTIKQNLHSRNISQQIPKGSNTMQINSKLNKKYSESLDKEAVANILNSLSVKSPAMKKILKEASQTSDYYNVKINENQIMSSKGINHEIKGKIKSKLQDFLKNNNKIKKIENVKHNMKNSRNNESTGDCKSPLRQIKDEYIITGTTKNVKSKLNFASKNFGKGLEKTDKIMKLYSVNK